MEAFNSAPDTMVMALESRIVKVKRTRIGRPKVKTGCQVCKTRRVKCDETKPECLRCIKFGMKCEGYQNPKLQQLPRPRHIGRTLLPKNDNGGVPTPPMSPRLEERTTSKAVTIVQKGPKTKLYRLAAPVKPCTPDASNPTSPTTPASTGLTMSSFSSRFQDPAESRYFSIFHAQTAFQLSGFYSPNLWSHIVLQASEAEPSIRHAVISIGALEMTTISLRQAGRGQGIIVKKETEEHHFFALQQYHKAICEMQKLILQNPERNCRTALIASLLIICFETYHGNYQSAAKQIATGVRLIEQRSKLALQPTSVEEEILCAFDRLDIQSMGHTDPFTLEEHLILKDSGNEKLSRMPTLFPSVLKARNYFNIVVRRAAHYGCALWQTSHQTTDSESWLIKPTLGHMEASEHASADLVIEKQKYLDELANWYRAFRPLFDRAQPGTDDYLPTRHLQMHYLPVYLTIIMYPATSEMAYDEYLLIFKEVIEMGKIQLAGATHNPMFSFDMQNVWPLFVVAKKCRDPVVRRDAIRLLMEFPRREGIWDSSVVAAISSWIVNIEEEGMVGGYVEERKRVKSMGVRLDSEKGRADVWCSVTNDYGETIRKKTTVQWDITKRHRARDTRVVTTF